MKSALSVLVVFLLSFFCVAPARAGGIDSIAKRAVMSPATVTKQVTTGSFTTINRVNSVSLNSIKQVNMATLDMTKHVNTATLNMTKQVNMGSLTLTKQLFKDPGTAVKNLKAYAVDSKDQMVQEKNALQETNAKYMEQHKGNAMEAAGYVKSDKADLNTIIKGE